MIPIKFPHSIFDAENTQKIGKKSQHLGGPKKPFGANEISSANLLADLRGSNLRS